jgi:hypothetical protein
MHHSRLFRTIFASGLLAAVGGGLSHAAPAENQRDFATVNSASPFLSYTPGIEQDEISCSRFLETASQQDSKLTLRDGRVLYTENLLYEQYIAGYVTAANRASRDAGQQIQVEIGDIRFWIKSYCTMHPKDNLLDAIEAFADTNASDYKE